MMETPRSPEPPPTEEAPYWEAAARGVLLLKRCCDTGKVFHYPRTYSPFTGGPTEWVESGGEGVVYACSLDYRAKPPNCIAYIQLDDGPLMLSGVLDEDLGAVAIGQRVRVVFEPDDRGRPAPFFRRVLA